MDLQIKNTTIGNEITILDSEQKRHVTKGITVDHTKITADDDGNRILKLGTRLGKITDTGKYSPAKVAEVVTEAATGQKEIQVQKGTFIQVGDELQLNGETGNVDSIDTDPVDHDLITLEANIGNAISEGTDIYCTDGSGVAELIFWPHTVNLRNGDQILSGLDMARVIENRLPGYVTDKEKSDLKMVTFKKY